MDSSRQDREVSTGEHTSASPLLDHQTSHTLRLEPNASPVPQKIGRFVLFELLGEGGYGQVYRAYDPQLDRDVALKILKTDRLSEKAIERFCREAKAAARLDHANIVIIHDSGRDESHPWIAYQLILGRTLSVVRDVDRPSVFEAVRIVRDLALALDHAHSRGVYHRDLKPANVMIDDYGRIRLTDFGLARCIDLDSELTREGTVLGTAHYMSPEAAAGRSHEADGRSDLYSLGVILYELLCGRKPTDLPSNSPPWRYRPNPTPPTPRSVDRAIPTALDRICMKALAFHPADRYPDGRSMADALTTQLGPDAHRLPQSGERLHSRDRRSSSSIVVPSPPLSTTGQKLRFGAGAIFAMIAMALVGGAVALKHRAGPTQSIQAGMLPVTESGLQSPPREVVKAQPAEIKPIAAVTPVLAEAPMVTPPPPKTSTAKLEPTTAKAEPAPKIIGNRNKKSFHRPSCSALINMLDRNQRGFEDAEEAIEAGYSPCAKCNPASR